MNFSRFLQLFISLCITGVITGSVYPQTRQDSSTPLVSGMDHIPLAVTNLDSAAGLYRKLGFSLKPGRPHANSIINQHIKFPDGTEIELISALEARDQLSSEYLNFLKSGDGPAFVGFYAPEMDDLADHFDFNGMVYHSSGGLLTFPVSDKLRYIFFGRRLRSPTDKPEYFNHRNSAAALIGVWISAEDFEAEYQLFNKLGALISEENVFVPEKLKSTVIRLNQAEVVILPASRQLVPGRKIAGAIILVRDMDKLIQVLLNATINVPEVIQTDVGRSLFLPPGLTNGIWLEFREYINN